MDLDLLAGERVLGVESAIGTSCDGSTALCGAAQHAASLGFDSIILVGTDVENRAPTKFEQCYRDLNGLDMTLVDATPDAALDCIPRVSYERLFPAFRTSSGAAASIGIDLTQPIAAIPTGMRASLLSTLRNTVLLGSDVRFVAFCADEDVADAYRMLADVPGFGLRVAGDPSFEEEVASLDAVVFPFNDIETALPVAAHTRRIAYLNDLIPLTQPGFSEVVKQRYVRVAEAADALLCLSPITKAEIAGRLDVDPRRCFVAPPAIDDSLTVVHAAAPPAVGDERIEAVRSDLGITGHYLVYPAAFRPHKNHRRLFEAIGHVATEVVLVLTTGETHNPAAADAIRAVIDDMGLAGRILVAGHLSVLEYRALLAGSEAVVFPSLEEGFGIPVLEAQVLRVPVIASRSGALGDVALGSLEIDPLDPRDIAEKLGRLFADRALRSAVAESGWQNSRRFTKEAGARGLMDAIAFVLDKKAG